MAVDATSGNIVVTLPTVAASIRKVFIIKKTDSSANTATVTRASSDTIDGATTYVLSTQYDSVTIESDSGIGWVILSKYSAAAAASFTKYTLSAKSSSFTANGTGTTFYQITANSAIAVTLGASPADGTVYKFIVVAGNGLVTFTANGSEKILNGSQSDSTLTLTYLAGSVELIAVTGGWQVT